MKTKAIARSGKATPPPQPMPKIRLLTEHSTGDTDKDYETFDLQQLSLRATTITIVLQHELDQVGYDHGGLNE
jgi:hypothetical protein